MSKSKMFYFHPEIKISTSDAKIILYDLLRAKILFIDKKEFCVLNVESGIIQQNPQNDQLLKKLVDLGYGFWSTNAVAIEQFKDYNSLLFDPKMGSYIIHTAYVEINTTCLKNCRICCEKPNQKHSCVSCYIPGTNGNKSVDFNKIEKIFEILKKHRVKTVVLCGGNPFDAETVLKKVLNLIMKFNFQSICILTNGENISQTMIDYINKNEIKLLVSTECFLSKKILALFEKVNNNLISQLTKKYSFIADTEQLKNDMQELKKNFHYKTIGYSYIKYDSKPDIFIIPPTVNSYYTNLKDINCMHGKVFVSLDGTFGACPNFCAHDNRKAEYSLREHIENIHSQLLDKYKCLSCELKAACFMCVSERSDHDECDIKKQILNL